MGEVARKRRRGAARPQPIAVSRSGVESEPTHFKWMKQHLKDNAVDARRATLVDAAVARDDGHVWFHVGAPADWYGQAVTAKPYVADSTRAERSPVRCGVGRGAPDRTVARVHAVSLRTLLEPLDHVDLIDADIRGAEQTRSSPQLIS